MFFFFYLFKNFIGLFMLWADFSLVPALYSPKHNTLNHCHNALNLAWTVANFVHCCRMAEIRSDLAYIKKRGFEGSKRTSSYFAANMSNESPIREKYQKAGLIKKELIDNFWLGQAITSHNKV